MSGILQGRPVPPARAMGQRQNVSFFFLLLFFLFCGSFRCKLLDSIPVSTLSNNTWYVAVCKKDQEERETGENGKSPREEHVVR